MTTSMPSSPATLTLRSLHCFREFLCVLMGSNAQAIPYSVTDQGVPGPYQLNSSCTCPSSSRALSLCLPVS